MPRGLELLIAQTILQGFDAQYGRFLEVTSGAQQRFEQADWHAVQQAMKNRIHLYDHHVGLVVEQLRCITNGQSTDAAFLLRVKEHYTRLLPDYPRFEIAESFFNSVYCRLFDHRSLTPERLFIFSSQPERRFRTIPRPGHRRMRHMLTWSGVKPPRRIWNWRVALHKLSTRNIRANCWLITARRRSTGRKTSTTKLLPASSSSCRIWATSSSSSPWQVSTACGSTCLTWQTPMPRARV